MTITVNGSKTLENLVPGTYTVKEQDADIEGYTLAVTGDGEVTVEAEKETKVTVTNTYTQKLGSLKITKVVEGDAGETAAEKTYTFTITGPEEYSETVTIPGNESETLEGLVSGEYTVTEDKDDAYINGYTLEVTAKAL